MLVDKYIWNIK